MNRTELKNKNTEITFRPDEKQISGRDFVDQNNLPAFYTKKKRNIAKAWAEIKASFNDGTRLRDVMEICNKYNLCTHYWCMMD
jgi:hypothetical protein